MWYKIRDFYFTYHLTSILLSLLIVVDILFLVMIHQMTQFAWMNGSMLFIIVALFCHEHAKVSFDPDTAEYRHWNVAAELIFIIFLIGLCIMGTQVTSLYQ